MPIGEAIRHMDETRAICACASTRWITAVRTDRPPQLGRKVATSVP
jgi:hypothetical protein